jgi:hypothetical protein
MSNTYYTIEYRPSSDNYKWNEIPRTQYWDTLEDGALYFDKAIKNVDDGKYYAHLCINGISVRSKATNHIIE